ncbi:MAG: DUF1501 domain-containing protein [Planctomycetes bacterium]|nr:DUF1501 domain-containing protein [Planctomycetota bacterium]
MPSHDPLAAERSRRWFFRQCGAGLGRLALASLLGPELAHARAADDLGARDPLAPKPPPLPAKAKRIVYLHMAGSPSQLDLFDEKPKLRELDRQPCPDSLLKGEMFAFIKGHPKILASPYSFASHGESGQRISELLPNLARVADKLCVVRSMHTTQFNHAPAQLFMHTGHFRIGRPSFGSWLTYGLGSENRDLPGFVVLLSGQYAPDGGTSLWGSGFLPTIHQGVRFRSQGDAVLFLSDPDGLDRAARRRSIDAINALNAEELARAGDPEIQTRIAQYELAFRMQASVPDLIDLGREPESVREAYGVEPGKVSFANNCLLARRLLERDVRFVQLYHWGWDSHGTSPSDDIVTSLKKRCDETDKPIAALLEDLEQRGLLDDTLVVWSGEFGRTPMNEERDGSQFLGRDHHPHAFTLWLAGAGIRRGASVGATDELGYRVVEDPISAHDLHATLLHLFGFDHERLTYRFQGRDFRLTDVEGVVQPKLLA